MKKLLVSTVASSLIFVSMGSSFAAANELDQQSNQQQNQQNAQEYNTAQNGKLNESQRKQVDKDFVSSGWYKQQNADGSTTYTMDDATMIAKMKENATPEQRKQIDKIQSEEPSDLFRAKKGVNSFTMNKKGFFTIKLNRTITKMVAGGGATVAGTLVSLIPGVGWTIAGSLASSLGGIFSGETIKGGVVVRGFIDTSIPGSPINI